MKNNTIPYNLEAEQSLLGCILIDQMIQPEILSELSANDFLVSSHQTIIEAMKEVFASNVPVDFVTLTDLLQKRAELEKVGGISYITNLTQIVPSSANYPQYLDIVKRDSVLRKLIGGANEIIRKASASTNSAETLEYAQSVVFNITEGAEKRGLKRLGDFFEPVFEKFEKIEKDKNFSTGLKTGFSRLDYITNGLHRGNLIILAARPSIGKTTLAMNIVENVAIKENASCAIFALEMTKEELAQRMLCSVGNVSMDLALKGKLSENDPNGHSRLWEAGKLLNKKNIYVDESSNVTPQDILARCRKHKLTHGLDLIVVDHIQLMEPSKQNIESRQQQVTDISRHLKMIAKELDVPVLALSQLSRQVTSRKGGRPVLSDLRESGAIEQDADLVLFIHRPDKDAMLEEAQKAAPNVAEIIIAKNRNGSCDTFELLFRGENVKFVNKAIFDDNSAPKKGAVVINDNNIPPEDSNNYPSEGADAIFDD